MSPPRYAADIQALTSPLATPADLLGLVERLAPARVVLLGEASHGTHEYYWWRAAVTRRLVEAHGFSFVAVEGDWPECAEVDASVRRRPGAPPDPRDALAAFVRWPAWMWRNEEVAGFARWLRTHNRRRDGDRAGFHGLDLYSMADSLRAVLLHVRDRDSAHAPLALAAYECLEPLAAEVVGGGRAARPAPPELAELLAVLRRRAETDGEGALDAWQNAEVVAGAQRYHQAAATGGRDCWNVRDRHMADALSRLLHHYGLIVKAVVWAHNTHVGDARATDMAAAGMVTLGQLARERYGAGNVALVGFGSYHGAVVAARSWGAPPRTMPVPPARPGTLEALLHAAAPARAVCLFPDRGQPAVLGDELPHRAIGAVYRPEQEWGNYVPTVWGARYDAFLWCDHTHGVRPLATEPADALAFTG